ncbi:MAG: hypothetical protein IKY83_10295, partial [Proteobacteria bacterium]|nr:hypothetical protein [Pseudomonadota bacterium]
MPRNQTAAIHEDKAQMKNVRDAVRIHRYEVTVGDVISETGLGDHEAEEALNDLMRTHACTLRVSEGGDLIYAFENGLAARKPPSWFHRHAWTIANAAKTAFQFLFMLVFVFYTAIATLFIGLFAFALLLITIPMWLPIWILKSIILHIFSEDHGILFRVLSRFAASRYQIDLENVLSFKYISKSIWIFFVGSSEEDKKYLPLHQRLSNFVFGPSEKSFARDERAACARLIHAQKGVITAEDWIFITGKSLKEAQSDLSMFTAEFGGKAEITKNGTLIYVFEKMMRTTDDVVSNPPSPVWESPAPRLPLTGNNSGKAGIVFISVIMFLIYGCYSFILMNQLNITSISFIMTFVSFVFYMTVFLFPLVRLPRNIKINHQRFAQTVKSGLLATLYSLSHPLKDHLLITYNDLDHAVDPFITMQDHDAHTSHALKLKALNEGITFLKENLGGRSSDDASTHSATIYDFDLMHTHLADAQEARTRLALRCQVTDGAQLAFSTDQEEQEKIDTREEKEEIASFDRKLIPDTGVSSLKESDSHDANDLKYTPPCT